MFRYIRTRLMVAIIPVILLAIMLTYIFSINIGKNIIGSNTSEKVAAEQSVQTSMIVKDMNLARGISDEISVMVGNSYKDVDITVYERSFSSIIEKQSMIFGIGIWFEPYVFDSSQKYVGPYVYNDNNGISVTYDYSNSTYDYFSQEYYKSPKINRKTIFTEVYYDKKLNMYMITCASPIWGENNQYLGCITVDIELNYVEQLVDSYNQTHESKLSVVSGSGQYLADSNETLVKNSENILKSDNENFNMAAKVVLSQNNGITSYQKNGEKIYVYYNTIDDLGWKILYELPEKSMEAPLKKFHYLFLVVGILSSIVLAVLIYQIVLRTIILPLNILEEELNYIGEDTIGLEASTQISNRVDEFGRIGRALIDMKKRLSQYQSDIQEAMEELKASNEEIQMQNEHLMDQEELLNEKTRYYTAIVEAMPDMVFVVSKDGTFIECEGNLSNLYVQKEDFIGKHINEVMPGYIADVAVEKISAAIHLGEMQIFNYQLENEGKNGYFELRVTKCLEDRAIGLVRDITESHNHMQEIEFMSYHDSLTGLYNRRYYERALMDIEAGKMKYPVSIILSDVNGLKIVNDSFGHDSGDLLLQKYTKILLMNHKEQEIIARIGGDEFAIILPNVSESKLNDYINQIEKCCRNEQVNGIVLSISFGYGTINDESQSLKYILNQAEDNMYKCKMFDGDSRHSKMIDVILQTLHEKNPREEQHSHRVADLCEKMALYLGKTTSEVQKIRNAALLHDIGKIGIPEEILDKPGALNDEEYNIICKHSEIGYRILQASAHMTEVSEVILFHHERWDGKGYPRGIKEEEIPLESRIISIADTYDAMVSDRSYRMALPVEIAIREIRKCAGTQFDPMLTELFVNKVMGM